MNSLLRTSNRKPEKRSVRPHSVKISAWAQVALMLWMTCFCGHQLPIQSSFDPEVEPVALGKARIDCAAAQPLGRDERERASQFMEVALTVSGQRNWFIHGPDLNGTYGGMQGTGGTEAVYNSANGYNCSTLNDVYGNEVFSFITYSGGYNFAWNPVYCTAYGPMYQVTPTPVNGVYLLGTLLNYRGHYVDGIGGYHFGQRDYQHPTGTFTTADPLGHTSTPDLYQAFNGDAVNQFDPTGRFSVGASSGASGSIAANAPTSAAFYAGAIFGGYASGAGSGLAQGGGQIVSSALNLDTYRSASDLYSTASGSWQSGQYLQAAGGYVAASVGVGIAAVDTGLNLVPGVGQGKAEIENAVKTELKAAVSGLSPEIKGLSEANIKNNGITVLGSYQTAPGQINYIQKATSGKYAGSSYFDLGSAWTPVEGQAANRNFLDIIGERGDSVIFSTPKNNISAGTSLEMEVQYLQQNFGYKWVNQWSMKPK